LGPAKGSKEGEKALLFFRESECIEVGVSEAAFLESVNTFPDEKLEPLLLY
jgi:hypothetical protein